MVEEVPPLVSLVLILLHSYLELQIIILHLLLRNNIRYRCSRLLHNRVNIAVIERPAFLRAGKLTSRLETACINSVAFLEAVLFLGSHGLNFFLLLFLSVFPKSLEKLGISNKHLQLIIYILWVDQLQV